MSRMRFEPDEQTVLEEGFVACQQQRLDAARQLLERAVRQSEPGERARLARFCQQLFQELPETDHDWWLLARNAPTTRSRFSCLKMAVRLNGGHRQAWHEIIALGKALPDVGAKHEFFGEAWNCLQVNTPGEILLDLFAIFTPEEELSLGERTAAVLRGTQTQRPVREGIVLRRFRDWAVTTGGIESLIASYDIFWKDIWETHWEEHVKEKGGSMGSYQDFLQALTFARAFFPVPPGPRAEVAQAYKQRLLPPPSNWFEDNRIHTALGGVRVRSKSEVIIANLLTMRDPIFL